MSLDMDTEPQAQMRLREFLDERGVRYSWVADRLGYSQAYITLLMQGSRRVTPDIAQRLGEIFDVDPAVFLPGEEATS